MSPIAFVIDDHAETRAAIAEVIRSHGWQALELADGIDCVRTLETNEPDALVLDLDMPVFDGERLIDYLEVMKPHLLRRTIVVTGWNILAARRDWPVRAVLMKPAVIHELLEALDAPLECGGSPPL